LVLGGTSFSLRRRALGTFQVNSSKQASLHFHIAASKQFYADLNKHAKAVAKNKFFKAEIFVNTSVIDLTIFSAITVAWKKPFRLQKIFKLRQKI